MKRAMKRLVEDVDWQAEAQRQLDYVIAQIREEQERRLLERLMFFPFVPWHIPFPTVLDKERADD